MSLVVDCWHPGLSLLKLVFFGAIDGANIRSRYGKIWLQHTTKLTCLVILHENIFLNAYSWLPFSASGYMIENYFYAYRKNGISDIFHGILLF